MLLAAYIASYLGIAIFVVAVIARFMMWSRMPMHMRWELYPVAHEGSKASYGGSYFEESKWWTRKREVSLIGELKVMVPEIVFLVALREHNRKLWVRSFPFHFGLYMVATCTVLMMVAGALAAYAPEVMDGGLGSALRTAIPVVGVAGLVLGILGALGLLGRRLSRELRDYTAQADIFNLVFFVVAFGIALATFVLVDRDFSLVGAFVTGLVTFNLAGLPASGVAGVLPVLSAILLAALVAYIPLTHMAHFVGKYFAYHAIRWNDEPNVPGGSQEKTIHELLGRPVTWSAPHIKGDGKRSWADVATEEQTK